MQQPNTRTSQRQTPRSLRETPLLLIAAVAVFIVAAILLAGLLLQRDEPDPAAGGAADKLEATATASATPPETTPAATSPTESTATPSGSTGAVGRPVQATATATNPNASTEPTTPAGTEPEPTMPEAGDQAPSDLTNVLPGLEDLPDGYVVTNEGSLALDEVAALHPDPAMQRQRLLGWGFTGASERQFEPAPDIEAGPDVLRLLATLVVEFRTPEGARAAVDAAHADAQTASNTEVSAVEIEPLGDLSLAASGTLTIDGETLQIAYVIVQAGDLAISFAGGSATVDPLPTVIEIAIQTINSL
jgi:hypothetical protein